MSASTTVMKSSEDNASLQRRGTLQAAKTVTTDVTRRMVCGGLAGMIAKVSLVYFELDRRTR